LDANSERYVPGKSLASAYLKRQKNNVAASHCFQGVEHSKPASPSTRARLAAGIKPDNYVHPAVPKVESVRTALRAEADHCARFPLQPAKIGIFVGVNASGQI